MDCAGASWHKSPIISGFFEPLIYKPTDQHGMATPKRLLNLSIIDKPSTRNDVQQYDDLDDKENLADLKV